MKIVDAGELKNVVGGLVLAGGQGEMINKRPGGTPPTPPTNPYKVRVHGEAGPFMPA